MKQWMLIGLIWLTIARVMSPRGTKTHTPVSFPLDGSDPVLERIPRTESAPVDAAEDVPQPTPTAEATRGVADEPFELSPLLSVDEAQEMVYAERPHRLKRWLKKRAASPFLSTYGMLWLSMSCAKENTHERCVEFIEDQGNFRFCHKYMTRICNAVHKGELPRPRKGLLHLIAVKRAMMRLPSLDSLAKSTSFTTFHKAHRSCPYTDEDVDYHMSKTCWRETETNGMTHRACASLQNTPEYEMCNVLYTHGCTIRTLLRSQALAHLFCFVQSKKALVFLGAK